MNGPQDDALAVAETARELSGTEDAVEMLQRMVEAAAQQVPGAAHAAVSLARRGSSKVETVAKSDEVCQAVDDAQYDIGEGPCLDAAWELDVVKVDDLLTTDRWPQFAQCAVALGVRSMLALQLYVDQESLGALNLYATVPDAFDDRSIDIARLFAAHAAVAYVTARKITQLKAGLDSRNVIGQAQGILMATLKVTAVDAFMLLTRASQHRNVKLRELADEVVQNGELLGFGGPPSPRREGRVSR